MGANISNKRVSNNILNMSNGLTSVLLDVLCLSGSVLAANNFEKDLMIWLAQKDENIFGSNDISFDISEMGWKKETFDQQKKFILTTIDNALSKKNWHLLDYSPREDWTMDYLQQLKQMIKEYDINLIGIGDNLKVYDFDAPLITKYDKCEKHQIFLHCQGCRICNNKIL